MPSQVAAILEEMGRNAARARESSGAIWGQTVAGLGQVPGQIMAQHAQQIQQQQQQQDRQLRNIEASQNIALGNERLQTMQEARADQALTAQLVTAHSKIDPETGHLVQDHEAIGQGLLAQGRTGAYERYLDFASKNEETINKIQNDHLALEGKKTQWRANTLGYVASLSDDQQPGAYATMLGTLSPLAKQDPVLGKLPDQYPGKDALSKLYTAQLTDSERQANIKNASDLKFKEAETRKQTAEAAKAEAETAQGPKLGTPEEQYLRALTSGDQATAERVLTSIRMTAAAKQDPAQAALARELAGLRVEEATARLADRTQDVGVQADTRTTATGRQWVDLSKYKGKEYTAAQQQAHAQGVYGASKEEADALQNIDVARQNMSLIAGHLDKLPTSAGTRVLAGPANKLQAYFQTDEDLAAWGTWRTAAIQAMRALAGSKGLRINRSEIEASTENDIPKITDTIATANEKLKRVRAMLDSQENGMMGTVGGGGGANDPMGIR